MEPLEGSQPVAAPSTAPVPSNPQQHSSTDQQRAVVSAVSAVASERPGPEESAAPQSVVRAVPLPALRLEHFQTADVGASSAPADVVQSSAVTLTSLTNFDHAAYAEFQALFDVPAGQSAPYLLPPERGRGRFREPGTASSATPAASSAEQASQIVNGVAARKPEHAEQLHDDVARRVREYLHSETGRDELARVLHELSDGKAGR